MRTVVFTTLPRSRHITLDDIRTLIIKGEKIKVVEDKSGHDITRHILLQVIAEQEQFRAPDPLHSGSRIDYSLLWQLDAGLPRGASSREEHRDLPASAGDAAESQLSKMVANTPSRPSLTSRGRISRHFRRSRKPCWAGWRPNATNNDVPGPWPERLLRCNGRNRGEALAHELQCASCSSAPSTPRTPRRSGLGARRSRADRRSSRARATRS